MDKTKKGLNIERPTPELLERYEKLFDNDRDDVLKEEVLEYFFKSKFPNNNDLHEVLVKVTLLNSFYNTQILNKNLVNIARHIVELEIDKKLRSDDISIVNDIAYKTNEYKTEEINNIYSFASKYCSWHEPDKYPIVDSYTKGMLYYINKNSLYGKNYYGNSFTQESLNDYEKYVDIYNRFLIAFDLSGYSYKRIDKYLWKYSKEYKEKYKEDLGINDSNQKLMLF